MSDGDKVMMKWFVIPFLFVLPVVVLLWYFITGGGAVNSGSSSGQRDYLKNARNGVVNNTVVIKCFYKSGKVVLRPWLDGYARSLPRFGCPEYLN